MAVPGRKWPGSWGVEDRPCKVPDCPYIAIDGHVYCFYHAKDRGLKPLPPLEQRKPKALSASGLAILEHVEPGFCPSKRQCAFHIMRRRRLGWDDAWDVVQTQAKRGNLAIVEMPVTHGGVRYHLSLTELGEAALHRHRTGACLSVGEWREREKFLDRLDARVDEDREWAEET